MSNRYYLAEKIVIAIGLATVGIGFLRLADSISEAVPEITALREDVLILKKEIPAIAGDAGKEAGKGLVNGAAESVAVTAVSPQSALVHSAIKDEKTATVVDVLTNPVGAGAREGIKRLFKH